MKSAKHQAQEPALTNLVLNGALAKLDPAFTRTVLQQMLGLDLIEAQRRLDQAITRQSIVLLTTLKDIAQTRLQQIQQMALVNGRINALTLVGHPLKETHHDD